MHVSCENARSPSQLAGQFVAAPDRLEKSREIPMLPIYATFKCLMLLEKSARD
jgi:hypothetical protein